MIKFFRKIRQKLLTENKFNKYLIYAIGEIVLVVIGILIALSINNWNEARKIKKEEKNLYVQIIKDLDEEYSLLQNHLNISESLKATFKNFYEYSVGKTDSLKLDNPVLLFQSINFSSLVLQNHEQSVESISSDSIRSELNKYLLLTKELVVRRQEEVDNIKNYRRPFLMDHDIISLNKLFNDNTESSSIINTKIKASINSEAFEYFVAEGYASNQALIYFTKRINQKNRELKQQLQNSELMIND